MRFNEKLDHLQARHPFLRRQYEARVVRVAAERAAKRRRS
jgi:hypothetical protein